MKAENIVPIINALPDKETERLYKMLGVVKAKVTGPPLRKSPLITDGQATEYLIGVIKKPS